MHTLHCVVSIQAHCTDTQRHRSQLTVYVHMIIMYMYTGKNTDIHKHTLAETHPYTHTPAAHTPPQPLVLMDGSLITTLTLGLLSPHLSLRTCVHVSVCVCLGVLGLVAVSTELTHTLLISRLSLFLSFRLLPDTFTQKHTRLRTKHC